MKHQNYPWDSPGIAMAGPDFIRAASQIDGVDLTKENYQLTRTVSKLYNRALRTPGMELQVEVKPGVFLPATFIPGHIWGQHGEDLAKAAANMDHEVPPVDGPHEAEVMVIGKMPWKDELPYLRNLMGPSGEKFLEVCRNLRIKNVGKWYITNVLKFVPPDESKRIKSKWEQDCLPLLQMEIMLVKPKYILCLGADASKVLLGDKKFGVGYMEGRIESFSYQCPDEDQPREAKVMTVLHPVQAIGDVANARQLDRGLARFRHLINSGGEVQSEDDVDHRLCTTLEHAKKIFKEAKRRLSKEGSRLVAWDAEWQGQNPTDKGAYLRTLQMSWADKKAVCFKLRHAGGEVSFVDKYGRPAIKRLFKLAQKFMQGLYACGHYFVTDLQRLLYDGLDLIKHFKVPRFVDKRGRTPWEQCALGIGGFDTMIAAHVIEETSFLGLESVAMRNTTCPRWEAKLEEWKKAYCAAKGITEKAMEGYGDCPDNVLIGELLEDGVHLKDSYACYDPDATLRIAKEQIKHLSFDHDGNNVWEPFWESMGTLLPILEMMSTGMMIDRERLHELTELFLGGRKKKEEQAKEAFNWKDRWVIVKKTRKLKGGVIREYTKREFRDGFNIRSTDQVKEVLFGTRYNGKFDEKTGKPRQIRPKKAFSLELDPLIDTSKPPIPWADVVDKGETLFRSPSTNKQVLAILAQENPGPVADKVNLIRNHRFLDQALKQTLRPPELNDDGTYRVDGDGDYYYDKGLPACIDHNNIVHTHLVPTAETARWKSFGPNLQNITKNRDDDFRGIFGKDEHGNQIYNKTLRSMFIARPGFVFIEHDYKGAELFGAGVMSGSPTLIDHARRNTLPDGEIPGIPKHPEYIDIHSMIAVLAFKLNCDWSKKGLESVGAKKLRHVAKSVVFGLFYGRGAKAIAFAVKEQGVSISVDEAQIVIDTVYDLYPELVPFFAECRQRAVEDGVIFNCFGRPRRFPRAMTKQQVGEIERQAMNYPIQSLVASVLNRGVANLYWALRDAGIHNEVKMILAIHDAVLLEAPFHLVDYLANPETGLVRWAMSKQVPIYPTDLAGVPLGTGPYYLSMSHEVGVRWSEPFTQKDCERYDVPLWCAAA